MKSTIFVLSSDLMRELQWLAKRKVGHTCFYANGVFHYKHRLIFNTAPLGRVTVRASESLDSGIWWADFLFLPVTNVKRFHNAHQNKFPASPRTPRYRFIPKDKHGRIAILAQTKNDVNSTPWHCSGDDTGRTNDTTLTHSQHSLTDLQICEAGKLCPKMEMIAYCKTEPFTVFYDEGDHELISSRKWRIVKYEHINYAVSSVRVGGKSEAIPMHRLLFGELDPGLLVDHESGNGLDNRRGNLRVCRHIDNMKNRRKPKCNTSGFKGVYFDPRNKNWRAQIRSNNTKINLGSFLSKTEAAKAYDAAAIKHHGKFARLNFKS